MGTTKKPAGKVTSKSLYVSTEYRGLKIVIEPRTTVKSEVSGRPMKTAGKSFKFLNGRLYLSGEDEKTMDSLLAGEDGRRPPVGVKKISADAVKAHYALKEDTKSNKELSELDKLEKSPGAQGVKGQG